ncbi:MAG: YitT family protein [Tissierellia bacterium]|nr:YitT family protein [Tissierellia bacterium]
MKKYYGSKEEFLSKVFPLIMGCILMGASINMFYIPAKIISGGVTGIATIIEYQTGIPTGVSNFLINIPLFYISWKLLGKKFTFYMLFVTLTFTFFLIVTAPLQYLAVISDRLFNIIMGALICGSGAGLIFKYGACSGGFDIVAAVFKKFYNVNIGSMLMVINSVIVLVAAFIYGLEMALYTIFAMFLGNLMLDRVVMGVGEKKQVFIISKEYKKISQAIIEEVRRGSTLIDGQGAYTKENTKVIMTVVTTRQIVKIKEIIARFDDRAFMIISDASEVKGTGFISYSI